MKKMKKHAKVKFKGNLLLIVQDASKNIVDTRYIDNLLLNSGRSYIIDVLGGINSSRILTKIGIGDDATAAAVTDSGLISGIDIQEGTATKITTAVSGDTLRVQATFSFASETTIREACLMNHNAILLTQPLDGATRTVVSPDLVMPASSALTAVWTLQAL
jgi:hypothetical protein